MRILVVEDDPKIASFVVNGLKQSGYAIDHSADGQDAFPGGGLALRGRAPAGTDFFGSNVRGRHGGLHLTMVQVCTYI